MMPADCSVRRTPTIFLRYAPLRPVINMCHGNIFSTPVFAYRSQNVKLTKIKARTYRLQQFTVSLMILAFSLNKLF